MFFSSYTFTILYFKNTKISWAIKTAERPLSDGIAQVGPSQGKLVDSMDPTELKKVLTIVFGQIHLLP